ncbi:hypothetical protein ABBQ38_002487 [Trebouxia sp. C0009 RCD-2024]
MLLARSWNLSNSLTRFGEDALRDNSSFNSAALRALYIRKSRTIVPALEIGAVHLGTQHLTHEQRADSTFGQVLLLRSVCWLDLQAKFYGVMPGNYEIIWRTMKVTTGNVGLANSPVVASIDTLKVQSSVSCLDEKEKPDTCHMQLDMQQFNELPTGHWVDVPLGRLRVDHFSDVSSRLWCHSGDWKQGLAWDSVTLKDLSRRDQHRVASLAASSVAPLVRAGRQAADAACILQ